jgi:hypothetical protein
MSFTFSNGTEIFSEDNNIGLNVTEPRRTMDINGDLGLTGGIHLGISSIIEGNNTDDLKFYTSGTERMIINSSGNIGIGDVPVNGKLEIIGNSGSTNLTNNSFLKYNGNNPHIGISEASNNNSFSIYADGKIAALEFNAISDIRVKNIKSNRNINHDLDFVKQIKTYNYDFIDKNDSNNSKVGFIAQEIEKLNHNFVSKSHRFIPNIFKKFKFINNNKYHILISDLNINNINIGDKLSVEVRDNNLNIHKFKVLVIKKDSNSIFIQDDDYKNCNIHTFYGIFLYGTYVQDFLTIDINQLLSINTNCIKYLINKIEKYDQKFEELFEKIN